MTVDETVNELVISLKDEKILLDIAFVVKLLDSIFINDWILLVKELNKNEFDNDLRNIGTFDKPVFVEKNPVTVFRKDDLIGVDAVIDTDWVTFFKYVPVVL